MSRVTVAHINELFLCNSDPFLLKERFLRLLRKFVSQNEDPSTSHNYRSPSGDDLTHLSLLIADKHILEHPEFCVLVLKTFKILSRKVANRSRVPSSVLQAAIHVVSHAPSASDAALLRLTIAPTPTPGGDTPTSAAGREAFPPASSSLAAALGPPAEPPGDLKLAIEAANVLLNVCYEGENVERVVELGGVPPLVAALSVASDALQAGAAGALQSICFHDVGKPPVYQGGGVAPLVALLSHPAAKVQTRAGGAVHNLSSDATAIIPLHRSGCVPPLVHMLRSSSDAISAAAAGTIQNLSREASVRSSIVDAGALPCLADLLVGPNVQTATAATGALLNILGPSVIAPGARGAGAEAGGEEEEEAAPLTEEETVRRPGRQALRKILSLTLALGVAYHCLFPDLPLTRTLDTPTPAHPPLTTAPHTPSDSESTPTSGSAFPAVPTLARPPPSRKPKR